MGVKHGHASDKGTVTLDLHVASYHTDRCYRGCTEEYNESNLGLGLSYAALNGLDIGVGQLTNSFNNKSTYFVVVLNHDLQMKSFVVSPSLTLGATTGYAEIMDNTIGSSKFTPLAIPSVTVKRGKFSTNFGFIPTGYAGKSNVFTIRFGISLN
jgi:hypothetical protein